VAKAHHGKPLSNTSKRWIADYKKRWRNNSMRAVVLSGHGGPEVLTFADIATPQVGPEEVLVQVRATSLNRADLLQRMGFYPDPFPGEHEVPGMEFSGRVQAIGARVRAWKVGDEVMGIVSGGAYAEQLVVHERQAMRIPRGVSLADAAAIPEVFITAWDALVVQGGLTSGRWALVHAGASGVGTAAVQICKAIGAHVIATCSAGKVEAVKALGADVVVDYTSADFVEAVKAATGGRGVDVVLCVIGGDYLDRNVASLTQKGHIVQVGVMGGGNMSFNLAGLMPKRAKLSGTVLRARPLEEKIAISQRFSAEIIPLFESGKIRPVIDCRYPFSDIARAHEHMTANANTGKIVIDIGA
jgi:putative PIG3 family NAD(P)H quinone oxidoreductase